MPAGTKNPPEAPGTTRANSPVRQLSVFLHNRVGALLGLVKLLNDHQIEVLGLSVQDSVELTLVRLVVSDPETAECVFAEQGLSCAARVIIVVELREGVHDLGHALSGLLAAEINIHHRGEGGHAFVHVLILETDGQFMPAPVDGIEEQPQRQRALGMDHGKLRRAERVERAKHAQLALVIGGGIAKGGEEKLHVRCRIHDSGIIVSLARSEVFST